MLKRFYWYAADLQKAKVTGLWEQSPSPSLHQPWETVTGRKDDNHDACRVGGHGDAHNVDRVDDHGDAHACDHDDALPGIYFRASLH